MINRKRYSAGMIGQAGMTGVNDVAYMVFYYDKEDDFPVEYSALLDLVEYKFHVTFWPNFNAQTS